MANFFDRKRPAHGVQHHIDETTIVFVTVCAKDRKPWCACREVEAALRTVWEQATHWRVGRYVVMPDHVHFFAGMTSESGDLELWMRYWKRLFNSAHNNVDWCWQSGHWDTRIRSGEHFNEKWQYVVNNPVRKGLVQHPKNWQYQGEVFELEWR